MCGGGMVALPLWLAIPLVGGAMVGVAAERTVRGVAAVSGAAYTAGKLASNEAGKQLDHFLHPDVLANAIAADPANPRLYLQRAQATFAGVSAPRDRPTRPTAFGMRGMRWSLRGRTRRAAATRDLGGGGGGRMEEEDVSPEDEDKARAWKALEQAAMEEVVRDAQQSVGLSGGRGSVTSVEALYVLGLALDRLGRWAEAAEAFAHAIDALQASKAENDVEGNNKDEEAEEDEEEESEEEPLQRAHGGKRVLAAPVVEHKYGVQTFRKPTFCDHCSKLLVGFRNQGYECAECQSTIHTNCRQHYHGPCRASTATHCLRVIDFHVPTLCSQCRLPLLGLTKQGLHCARCKASVHERCAAAFNKSQLTCQPRQKKAVASSADESTVPGLAELYNCKGLALYHASQYEQAIVLFTTSASLAQSVVPQYTAIANRGLCHFYMENLDRAIDDLSQAVDHGVANEQTFSTRATAFQLMGKDDLAQADRRQALLYNPRAIVKVFPYPMPLELVSHVFSFLSVRDKARCAMTCHLWHDLAQKELVQPLSELEPPCYYDYSQDY